MRHVESFIEVMHQLLRESDRGAVVLAFSWMDEELTRVLRGFLAPSTHDNEQADELLAPGRAIGDAATKIDLAYRLGLISRDNRQCLHVFRRLRNDFAHRASSLTLNDPSVWDRIQSTLSAQAPVFMEGLPALLGLDVYNSLPKPVSESDAIQATVKNLGKKHAFAVSAGSVVMGLTMLSTAVTRVSPVLRPIQSGVGTTDEQ